MNRRGFLSALACTSVCPAQAIERPNIIFILADDLGYGDLGCYGQRKFATPHIDRMASEGIRFTQAYAGSTVCAPSRCCLMTGMHTGHARVRNNAGRGGRVPLQPDDVTVAEVLKQAGYRTAAIGKWGLGEAGTLGIPNCQGFDEWFGFLNQDHALDFHPAVLWQNQQQIFPPGNQGAKRKEHAQDLFTARALDFITKNRSNPFFLYLAYTAPHANSELGRDTGDGFAMPAVVPSYAPYADRDWPAPEKGFAALIHRLDRDVGAILAKLAELGIAGNTLVVFSSDNGPAHDGGHTPEFFSSAGGLRGSKGGLYEGGIRVPAIARWPGRIPPRQVSDRVWAFWDFLPTAAELAGLPPPREVDGISLAPLLFQKPARKHDYLYWEISLRGFQQAVRMEGWKGVRYGGPGNPIELYRLREDIGEKQNRAVEFPEVARRIESAMDLAHQDSPDFPVSRRTQQP